MCDEEVVKILITDKGRINPHYNKILNKYTDVKSYIENRFTDSESILESIYRIWKQIYIRPTCLACGNVVKFISGNGFRDTCSVSCSKKIIKNCHDIISDDIIKSEYLINGKLVTKNKLQIKYLKDHNYYEYLITRYNDCNNPSEAIYRICKNIKNVPTCPICNKPCCFLGIEIGYDNYCSDNCRSINELPEITDEYIKTLGPCSKLTKPKWPGRTKVEEYLKNRFKNEYRDYYEAVYMITNDIEHIPRCPVCNKKVNFEANHYGSEKYPKYCSAECAFLSRKQQTANKVSELLNAQISIEGKYYVFHDYCSKHQDFKLTALQIHDRVLDKKRQYINPCPICNPPRNPETSIESIIKDILIELNITNFKQHYRKILSPKELDFYLPEYNLAIECNGVFWHSDCKKEILYHYDKMKSCQEKGIQLMSFWEPDIINNRNKIKDIIAAKCGKNKKIYARLCTVKEISPQESKKFLDMYHLQGNINAKIKLGLFYNGRLVEVMTFGKKRVFIDNKGSDKDYELYRLCTKGNYSVIGGAGKLLKYFKNNYKWNSIVSYCMSDISNGNVYEQLGFSFAKENKVNYFYYDIQTGKIMNRYALAKHKIDDHSGRTADEIIKDMHILKCYTSGTKTYILKNC